MKKSFLITMLVLFSCQGENKVNVDDDYNNAGVNIYSACLNKKSYAECGCERSQLLKKDYVVPAEFKLLEGTKENNKLVEDYFTKVINEICR